MKRFFGKPDPEIQAIRREFWLLVHPFVRIAVVLIVVIGFVLW